MTTPAAPAGARGRWSVARVDAGLGAHLGLVLVLVGLLVTLAAAAGTAARATYGARLTADEPQYLLMAISLAEDHDLDVSDERAELRYRPFHEVALPLQSLIQPDGRQLVPHDPLLPALLAGPVAIGGWVAAKLTLAVVAGVLAALLVWTAVRRLAVGPLAAVAVVLAFALSPPFAVYGTQVYPELPAALAVTVAVACLLGPARTRSALVAGAALGALPWLSVKHGLVAAAVAAVGVAGWWRPARAQALTLAGLVAGAGAAYLLASRGLYGGWTPYAVGSHFTDGELTVLGRHPDLLARSARLTGLLTSRTAGLVAWAPVWLAAVTAVAAVVRRRPAGWALLLAPLATGWLVATFVAETLHGWEWPARQVLAVLPLAVLATAWWVGRVLRAQALAVVAPAGIAGAITYAVLVVEATTSRLVLVVDAERTSAPWYRLVQGFLPDLRSPSPATWALHAAWVAVLGGLAVVGWRSAAPPRPPTATAPIGSDQEDHRAPVPA